ncbi:MAG: tetratricopeptide repeat protein [Bacteroidota bacterium]
MGPTDDRRPTADRPTGPASVSVPTHRGGPGRALPSARASVPSAMRHGVRVLCLVVCGLWSVALCPAYAQATPEAGTLDPLADLVATEDGRALFHAAHAALIDWRLDAAEADFTRLGAMEPGSPAGAYGLSKVALWRTLVMERPPFPQRFFSLNDSLDDVLGAAPRGTWRIHLEGEREMHRAMVFMRQERFTKAARAFHAACGRFKATTRDADVPFAESYLGRGVCLVAAGAIPSEYKWIGALLGFRGTVQDGIETLERSITEADIAVPEAVLFLALADAALNERQADGLGRLGALAEAHPESALVQYLYGTLLLEERDAPRAERHLRAAADLVAQDGVAPLPFVDHHLGLALFRQDRFEAAADHLERYLREAPGRALVAQAGLHAGLARELLGDRRAAERHYRRVRATRDNDSDQQAEREAERRLAGAMTEAERAVLLGAAAYDGGRYAEAIPRLQPALGAQDADPTLRAEAAYRTGRAYQALDDDREALRHYRLAMSLQDDPLAKWGPWAIYHIGEVHEAAGDHEAAREAYEQALENEAEFDYHKSMEQRTKAALERLERAG